MRTLKIQLTNAKLLILNVLKVLTNAINEQNFALQFKSVLNSITRE